MNSTQALAVAIDTLIAHRMRLRRADAIAEVDDAINTLTALQQVLVDNERQAMEAVQRS